MKKLLENQIEIFEEEFIHKGGGSYPIEVEGFIKSVQSEILKKMREEIEGMKIENYKPNKFL